MNDALRSSSAHVIVDDVTQPALSKDDAHHLSRVLRLRDGEPVTCTDGRGSWVLTEWVAGEVRLIGGVNVDPAPSPLLTVAVVPLKADRTELVIEKLVEIGIDRIVVLDPTERSVVRWNKDKVGSVLDRYRRIVRSAVMQSRRTRIPEIVGPVPLSSMTDPGVAFAEPGGDARIDTVTTLIIGPEGGFGEGELVAAPARVDLGPAVLRAETAAIVGAARLVAHWRR